MTIHSNPTSRLWNRQRGLHRRLQVTLAILLPMLTLACHAQNERARTTVQLTVDGALERTDRGALVARGVIVDTYIGNGTYLALLPPQLSTTAAASEFDFLTDIEALEPGKKLDPALREGDAPEHARLEGGYLRLHVRAFDGLSEAVISALREVAVAVKVDDMSGAISVEVQESTIANLAAIPEVATILYPPEPGAL